MPFRLVVPGTLFEGLLNQTLEERPLEACGLLAGVVQAGQGLVRERFPLSNAAASPVLYEVGARAVSAAYKAIDARSLGLLAVYHSHPTSPPVPSATDHELWAHGEQVVCLIVSLTTDPPTFKGWWMLDDGSHVEAEVEVQGPR